MLEANTVITYLACIFFLFIIGRIFIVPLKIILKLIGNSIIGGILIFIINIIGNIFNFHIGLNIGTAVIIGILGVPRSNTFNIFEVFVMEVGGQMSEEKNKNVGAGLASARKTKLKFLNILTSDLRFLTSNNKTVEICNNMLYNKQRILKL